MVRSYPPGYGKIAAISDFAEINLSGKGHTDTFELDWTDCKMLKLWRIVFDGDRMCKVVVLCIELDVCITIDVVSVLSTGDTGLWSFCMGEGLAQPTQALEVMFDMTGEYENKAWTKTSIRTQHFGTITAINDNSVTWTNENGSEWILEQDENYPYIFVASTRRGDKEVKLIPCE